MQNGNPGPTDKQCVNCNSYQITERRRQSGIFVSLYMRCNACRQELLFWTGTVTQEKQFKKKRSRIKKILSR